MNKIAIVVVAMLAMAGLCMGEGGRLSSSMMMTTPVQKQGAVEATDFCPACTTLLPTLLQDLGKNSTEAEIKAVLDKVCDLLPSSLKSLCQSRVQTLINLLNLGEVQLHERYSTYATCTILELCPVDCCESPNMPEQIHLAVTGQPDELVVMWATLTPRATQVQFGPEPFKPQPDFGPQNGGFGPGTKTVNGTSWTYTIGGWKGFLHMVTLTDLPPATKFYYRVGDPDVWHGYSQPDLWFVTEDAKKDTWNIAVTADMGATDVSDPSIYRLAGMRQRGQVDMYLQAGDESYADTYQALWDSFMRKMEPIAGFVPLMTCPGNHESFEDFLAYRNRFGMGMPWQQSGSNSSLYYSFDYGPMHITSINTEGHSDLVADISPGTAQHTWIEQDLAKAAANRAARPWIIVMAHRPFYCVNPGSANCGRDAANFLLWLEDIFMKYGVDLVITGHVHDYQRTTPMYKWEPNPAGPVYVVDGAAGCKEHIDSHFPDPKDVPSWSAARYARYGFGFMQVTRKSLTWQFIEDRDFTVLDKFTLSAKQT